MAIVAGDILLYFSTTAGAAGFTTTGTGAGSLGKYCSTTQALTTLNGTFDEVSGAENAANDVEYRCIFVRNSHATLTWQDVKIWISAEPANTAFHIGLDPVGIVPQGQAGVQAATIANEGTAPAGVSFTQPVTEGTAITVGNVAPLQVFAVWCRRTAENTAAATDTATLSIKGDTAA